MPMTMREFPRPRIEVEATDYGFRLIALGRISEVKSHVRVTNLVVPNAFIVPMSGEMTIAQWHVPIDDVKHYWYAIFTSFGAPVDKEEMRRQRVELYELPDYVPRKNKSNEYGFDAHEQPHATYTGMGADINVHDQWACESMGVIQARTQERLGTLDKAISAYAGHRQDSASEIVRRLKASTHYRQARPLSITDAGVLLGLAHALRANGEYAAMLAKNAPAFVHLGHNPKA